MRHSFVRSLRGLLTLPLLLAAACSNSVPVGTLCEGLTLQVDERQTSRDPVKLDFLWVVDDSSSMSQEQTALAASIADFTETLSAFANVDIRTAVVTTFYESAERRGRFNRTWATQYPILAQTRIVFPTRDDGGLMCECAACQGFDEARAYQVCHDDPNCQADPATAPIYVDCLAQGFCPGQDDCPERWVPIVASFGAQTYNLNGSINAECHLTCGERGFTQDDADGVCQNCLQNAAMTCQMSSSGDPVSDSGCVVPPDTADCPADLPSVLPAYNEDGTVKYGIAEYFRCLATVGALQDRGANLEQGLRQGWLALSPEGPHPDQVCDPGDPVMQEPGLTARERRERCERVFLREDAYLVVIFVSDEEDCSVEEGKVIGEGDYQECGLLGDADTPDDFVGLVAIADGIISLDNVTSPRPLATVSKYANRFKALKPNPANVFLAAIVGDAWSPTQELSPAEVADARALYYRSLTDRRNNYRNNSYICASEFGKAFFGSRYIELAEMFGPHGFTANICSEVGIGPTLTEIAAELISEVISICLPRPVRVEDGEELVTVYKTEAATGERVQLVQGVDFNVVDEPAEGACPGSGRAIRFEKQALPLPDDTIQILYEAQAQCLL